MTNDNHPITPPPEMVRQWLSEHFGYELSLNESSAMVTYTDITSKAARWGADLELDLCVHEIYKGVGLRHIDYSSNRESLCSDLRTARRPKPPTLKQQALSELDSLENMGACNADTIRRALEALPDD